MHLKTRVWQAFVQLIQWRSMFGKIKKYATKKVLQSQLKNVPEDQRQLIMELVEKDPQLFETIAKEIQEDMKKNGSTQEAAAMKVFPKYQQQLVAAMSPQMRQKMMGMAGAPTAGKFNPNGSIRR